MNEVNIRLCLKEDITITADSFSDKKFEIFKNLSFSNINEVLDIELIGNNNEIVKGMLTRLNLSIIVPKGESLTLKKGTTYKYRKSYINTFKL